MTHSHHHCGVSPRADFAGQMLNLVVGVFGLVAVLMYRSEQLGYVLALPFHLPVLLGGSLVLALVGIRAVSVWHEARRLRHEHLDSTVHLSDPGTAADGHSHDPAWVFTRVAVLSFPVGLFLIGVPNSGFSRDRIRMMLGADDALTGNFAHVAYQNGTVTTFAELAEAAASETEREKVQGRTAVLEGRINRIDARQFTLFRLKMTCCAADTVPMKVRVVVKGCTLDGFEDFDWVQLTGRVQFVQAPNSDRYVPVVVVEDGQEVRKIPPRAEYD